MRLKSLIKTFHEELDPIYGREETNSFFNLLIEHYIYISRLKLILYPAFEINERQTQLMLNALTELKLHTPIQYILGETEFYGLPFKVDPSVLIPRPETEELVEEVLMSLKKTAVGRENLRILDIGTGSGCIAVTLAYYLQNAQVYGLDVSKEALDMAKTNAQLNHVDVSFLKHDILNRSGAGFFAFGEPASPAGRESRPNEEIQKFDVIVSNPPYVRQLERDQMNPNVLDNEPHLALFVENDNPLKFYKAICEFAQEHLKKGGRLFMEINEYLGTEMMKLLSDYDFDGIVLQKDIFGKDRIIKGSN